MFERVMILSDARIRAYAYAVNGNVRAQSSFNHLAHLLAAASVLSIRKQNDCSTRLGRRAFQHLIAREPQRIPDCSAARVIRVASCVRVSTRLSVYCAHALNGRASVAY